MFKVLILVASLVATPAFAGTYFKYVDDAGTVCVTDDIERVPSKYQDSVTVVTSEDLADSKRWTPVKG